MSDPLITLTTDFGEDSPYVAAGKGVVLGVRAARAGHLRLGVPPDQLGPVTDDWARLGRREPHADGDDLVGEVLFVDHFGNLISNSPAERIGRPPERVEVGWVPHADCR